MADRISEEQVEGLMKILRTDASIDAKVTQVTAVKSAIKQHNVPDICVAPLFEALRLASSSQHAILVNAGFTALNHLLTRLSRQDPKYIAKDAKNTLPLIVDRMGDQKEKFRQLALQAMTTMYRAAPVDVERSVRNIAMVGKNPRAKEAGMQWVLQMHQENGLQFRSYVPTLMELLEDADGMVRDAAKTTVIELFRNAPGAAKSDLKKQLKTFKVRPAIEQAIVKELIQTRSTTPGLEPEPDTEAVVEPVRAIRTNLAASVSSLSSERPITPAPDVRAETVEPSYVNSSRELEDILRDMTPFFEGRESEHNWLKREQSIHKLRRLMAGNAATDFSDQFLAGLRALLDGIIKTIVSLRTSLSKEGCSLVQEMALTYGPAMDPMVELLMQTFIKLSAATKKIASQQANVCIDTMISKVTYNNRIMQHVAGAVQDKNVQPRLYATVWLKTLLTKEAHHKNHVEHTGGLDLIEKSIKKGLNDPNPSVREKMRATYWTFATIWPARAEALKDTLDAQAQKLLDKDPHNPNSPKPAAASGTVRPGLGLSRSTMGGNKPSLKETLLAQKKAAMAAKGLPPRPGSAMSHFSPVRTVSNSSTASTSSTATTTTATATATRQKPAVGSGGGLSVAPVRPSRGKRPEMAPRPATAGPYSVRGHDAAAEAASPPTMRTKATTPKTMGASPKRTMPKVRSGHKTNASETSIPTPSRLPQAKSSPAASPVAPSPRPRLQPAPVITSSPSKAHEDLTLVVPNLVNLQQSSQPVASPEILGDKISQEDLPNPIVTPSKALRVFEDPASEDHATPRPVVTTSVLEEKPVNEDAANLILRPDGETAEVSEVSPEKARQHSRLIDSAIAKINAKSLDVHGFRKLQGILRDNKVPFADEKFDTLLRGLFEYIEDPQNHLAPEKVQDVKAQILATLRILLKKHRDNFQPQISKGLDSLLAARAVYDARSHIVSGLELLADELVTLGDAQEIATVLTNRMAAMQLDAAGCRSMSIGLHSLAKMVDVKEGYVPTDGELANMAQLCGRCLGSVDSGVRMDAVQLCVALHARIGDQRFWEALQAVKDDPKNLISYYIEKRRRENTTA